MNMRREQVAQSRNELSRAIRTLITSFFGIILAGAFAIIFVTNAKDKFVITDNSVDAGVIIIFICFMWFEWLWTQMFFRPERATNNFHLVCNFIIEITQLTSLVLWFVLLVKGDPDATSCIDRAEPWFILYLFTALIWGWLNEKDTAQRAFNLVNLLFFLLGSIFYTLDVIFELVLREHIIVYMMIYLSIRIVVINLYLIVRDHH